MSRRQARWLETLQSQNFVVKYRPGKMNIIADALSRLNVLTILTAILTDNETFAREYPRDKYFAQILRTLQHPELADEKEKARAKYFE